MAMQTFVNLPVKDLPRATEFFTALGFSFDPRFTDENATRMIISEDTSVMLAAQPFFKGFIEPQDIADTSRSREVIVGSSAESRQQVDDLVEKALAAGAQALGEPEDQGFMYMRGFRDPRRPSVVVHPHGHVRDPGGLTDDNRAASIRDGASHPHRELGGGGSSLGP